MSDTRARIADELAAQIHGLLRGQGPQIQGAALADLAAIWLSGHIVLDNTKATGEMRREIFKLHCDMIWQLVEHYDDQRRRG